MLRSANPTMRGDVFRTGDRLAFGGETMTVQGTASKSLVLWLLLVLAATFTWRGALVSDPIVTPLLWIGTIGGFVVAILTGFKRAWAPVTAPLYAVLEGLALGGISAYFELRFPGIAIQACGLTVAVFGSFFALYKTGVIVATDGFKRGLFAVTAGIALFYLVQMVLGLFGVRIPMIHESGPIGIAFSVGIAIVAALNLVLDFDMIESGARQRAPKYMEWYGAFALLVTLVWLYLELLRLLAKLRGRD